MCASAYTAHHSTTNHQQNHYQPYSSSNSRSNRVNRNGSKTHSNKNSKLSTNHNLSIGNGKNQFGKSFGKIGGGLVAVNWDKIQLKPFHKNFYREDYNIKNLTKEEIDEWRKKNNIFVFGRNIPKPIRNFEETGFPEYILTEIKHAGFTKPTTIQSQGWPMALSGRDVVGIAETGSGKTLTFLLPSIVHINAQELLKPGDGPIVLIIAPTRELAIQIENEAAKFGSSSKIRHACIYGGVERAPQERKLKEGIEICICTPGRLLDFLETKTTNLRRVTYLVIDEADRLLDMGFEPQLKLIMAQIRPDRQTLMWSATWPKEVETLAKEFTSNDKIQVSIGSLDMTANHNVTQLIEVIHEFDKNNRLNYLLEQQLKKNDEMIQKKILIFISTKKRCEDLNQKLLENSWSSIAIHGNKQQDARDRALKNFKDGKCQILLATDVASRGLHIENISMVINYDFPGNIEDYIHRIGRTGRCGKKGVALSFFTPEDGKRAPLLVKILKEANQFVPSSLQQLADINTVNNDTQYNKYSKYNSRDNNNPRLLLPKFTESTVPNVLITYHSSNSNILSPITNNLLTPNNNSNNNNNNNLQIKSIKTIPDSTSISSSSSSSLPIPSKILFTSKPLNSGTMNNW